MDILSAAGNTSLVRPRKVVPDDCAASRVKLEWENPARSMKDRMAQAVISRGGTDAYRGQPRALRQSRAARRFRRARGGSASTPRA